jgi:hypothetical protein
MQALKIPAGTKVFLGRPAKPMPENASRAIARLLSEIPNLSEAHLPQCFAAGAMEVPSQILVLVVESETATDKILQTLSRRLPKLLHQGTHLEVWPIERNHPSLPAVRRASCRIL